MLLEIYILMEILMFTLFLISYFTRQDMLWIITSGIAGIMMVNSYNVEIAGYLFNAVTGSYEIITTSFSYPYLMGINLMIFALALLFGTFDIWDKSGHGNAGM